MNKRLLFLLVSFAPVLSGWCDESDIEIKETCPNPMITFEKQSKTSRDGLGEIVAAFTQMDINHDGQVCYSEVKKHNPNGLVVWGRFDIDGNGCITAQEAKEGVERNMEYAWKSQHRGLDTNRDGFITEVEMSRRYKPEDGGMSPTDFILEFDVNADQQVDQQEYIQGMISIIRSIKLTNPRLENIPPRVVRSVN